MKAKIRSCCGAALLAAMMAVSAGAQSNPPAPVTLIPSNAVWRYLDTGTNLGTAWRSNTFSDFSWPSGPAELGFGDGDEATVLADNGQITTYFRQRFVVSPGVSYSNLSARLTYDDGAVVYLNGQEAFRVAMPFGPISNSTLATATGPDNAIHVTNLPPSLLVPLTNLLAVEVHQASPTNTDLSFAFVPRYAEFDPVACRPFRVGRHPVIRHPIETGDEIDPAGEGDARLGRTALEPNGHFADGFRLAEVQTELGEAKV